MRIIARHSQMLLSLKATPVIFLLACLFFIGCSKEDDTLPPIQSDVTPQSVTFMYEGEEVSYGIVSHAGIRWLDRNLGAQRVAISFDDQEAFGDYFQWGREADGHQLVSFDSTDVLVDSAMQPGHSLFIVNVEGHYDWTNETTWITRWVDSAGQRTEADPCPCGWRVPTIAEWGQAIDQGNWTNREDAYVSPLKLTSAGIRNHEGALANQQIEGFYWSASPTFTNDVPGTSSRHIKAHVTGINNNVAASRTGGFSIRCIEDK